MIISSSPFSPLRWRHPNVLPYTLMAGPCSAETEEQTLATALELRTQGVSLYRASLWKPRTRPGGFEGVGEEGIPWLQKIERELDMQVATEVASPRHIEAMLRAGLTTFWIGARTTASPITISELATALRGVPDVTVLVKNPISPDLELWEGTLLRFLEAGVTNLGAVHRGFSTYGASPYRNSPLWQIPLELRHRHPELTILVDPSHIGGKRELIEALSRLALDMNFDGLIIETHPSPDTALSDSAQQITPSELRRILGQLSTSSKDDDETVLKALRSEIDNVDQHLLELLAERMTLSERIGRYKSQRNEPIVRPERFRALLAERLSRGEKLGLPESLIRTLFDAIHSASVSRQEDIF